MENPNPLLKNIQFGIVKKYVLSFDSYINFKSIAGNLAKMHLNTMIPNIKSKMTQQDIETMTNNPCNPMQDIDKFIGRLIMTDLQLIIFMRSYRPDCEFSFNIFEHYMCVPLNVHMQILQELSQLEYINLNMNIETFTFGITGTIADFAMYSMFNLKDYNQYLIPCTKQIWMMINTATTTETNIENISCQESKSLF